MKTQRCTRCGHTYPQTDEYFSKVRNGKVSGLHSWCKACHSKKEYKDLMQFPIVCWACNGLVPKWSCQILLAGRAGEFDWPRKVHICSLCQAKGIKMARVPKSRRKRSA